MTSAPQRWARVPPRLAWKRPGLPTEWTRVLERNEEAMRPEPLPCSVDRTFDGVLIVTFSLLSQIRP
jgi:hypothetical protein